MAMNASTIKEAQEKLQPPRMMEASTLINDSVTNINGEDLGRIKDLMIDLASGRVIYAVIAFGSHFLGMSMSNKLFAVPWQALGLSPHDKKIILNVPREKMETAPSFDKNNMPSQADTEWVNSVYEYYGYTRFNEEQSRQQSIK